MYFKLLSLLLTFFIFSVSTAQNPIHFSVSNTTLAATDSVLPFWFVANRHGKIKPTASFLNISEIIAGQAYNPGSKMGFTWGGDVLAAFGKSNYYQINQAFAGFALQGWEIKGGMFYDEVLYAGLSTSNGNMARSQNARPVPRVRLSTLGYKPVPFVESWFSFKAEFEEGFLNDERYVKGAHLHHKSLYGKIQTTPAWSFRIGFEHYAMWGGISQNETIGQLPDGLNAYWHYVFALPGTEEFLPGDQQNISGNQLGTYQLEFIKDFKAVSADIYLSHPWEDNSGLNWHNWPDNLLGLHLHVKDEKKRITDVVYEFTNTRQQGLKDSLYTMDESSGLWVRKEYDNYYNHSVYNSGFTYQQQVMSSPLFYPVIVSNGISRGIQSNRFFSHHLGISGNLSEYLTWKGLLTYIQHLGTYSKSIPTKTQTVVGFI